MRLYRYIRLSMQHNFVTKEPGKRVKLCPTTHVRSGVGRRLLAVEADVRHLDDVLQLARLLLDLGGEEERGGGDRVAVEPVEGVEHVEPLHVHDRSVDAQLSPGRRQSCLLFSSVGFRYGRIIRGQNEMLMWGGMWNVRPFNHRSGNDAPNAA